MRKLNRYLELSAFVVLVLLASCVTSDITMDKIQFVERGLSSSNLSSMLERKPHKVLTVVDPKEGLEYHVHIYDMQTGTETFIHTYQIGDVWYSEEIISAVYEEFAFLFFKDSLLFWGFLHEFLRSHDPLVRRLAPLIIEMSRKEREKEYILEIN
jgi:hypothetical protein